jgi:molecular chaperone GrpE
MEPEPERIDPVETPEELNEEGVVSDEAAFSSPEPHQRAGAAAAYAAAQHKAPSKPGEPAGESEPEPANDQDLDELAAKAEKADEYLLLAQRTQADFENYRKRSARDAALAQERGISKLAKELLPAVDNLDRALQAAATYASGPAGPDADSADSAAGDGPGSHEGQLIDGLKLVHAELLAALARVGIEPFSPVGEPFDPQHHEAVAQHQVEGQTPGTVIEVYQQGFRHGDSVLRPARVLVAS